MTTLECLFNQIEFHEIGSQPINEHGSSEPLKQLIIHNKSVCAWHLQDYYTPEHYGESSIIIKNLDIAQSDLITNLKFDFDNAPQRIIIRGTNDEELYDIPYSSEIDVELPVIAMQFSRKLNLIFEFNYNDEVCFPSSIYIKRWYLLHDYRIGLAHYPVVTRYGAWTQGRLNTEDEYEPDIFNL